MDGGVSPDNATDKDDDEVPPVAESLSGVRLADAPILLFVYFHKALRTELSELRRVAVTALEEESCNEELILELQRRFEFLKLVYKYHCSAEDEVVFLALDVHIKNVASSYSLEHESIDELFGSVFNCLNGLQVGNEHVAEPFKELVIFVGTIRTFICQHMLKEEEQVYPLLMQQFSSEEQASLVLQFLWSVPVVLLEDFLPWMVSFLTQDESIDVRHCVKEILSEEASLQEVVISWLGNKSQPSFMELANNRDRVQHLDALEEMESTLKSLSSERYSPENCRWKKAYGLQTNSGHTPLDGLPLWHRAIRKDLEGILDNLHQMKSSNVFLDLDAIVVQLKFFLDVLTFYSAALKTFYNPVLKELSNGCPSPSEDQFRVEGLQQLLDHFQNCLPLSKFVENLFNELECFLMDISTQFAFHETEVLTFRQNHSHEMQQLLLYKTLHIMPLGLLKCVITWFSAHLSEDESRSILHGIYQGDSLVNKSFACLLREWFHIGYSGKTPVENFTMDLQKIFKNRCSLPYEQTREIVESSSLPQDMQPCKGTEQGQLESIFTNKGKKYLSYSLFSDSLSTKKYQMSHSSATSLHTIFQQTVRTLHPLPEISVVKGCNNSIIHEPIPMDLIFFGHKALKKDLEYLVFGSAQLAENVPFLIDFHRRFHLIQFLYQIHSDAEDEIAFPALEAKGKLQNVSHSYSIDHRLEAEHFRKISHILNKMLELQVSVSHIDPNTRDRRMLKYRQLCIRLHEICKSMHKLLSEHVHREETELWPLFREFFTMEEQEKIIKGMLGRIRAETLQDMIPWLMASLTLKEQHTVMSLWCNAAKNTMFEEWLGEWWEGYHMSTVAKEPSISPSTTADPLEIISTYLSNEVLDERREESLCNDTSYFPQKDGDGNDIRSLEKSDVSSKAKSLDEEESKNECSECMKHYSQKPRNDESLLPMSQEDLEALIRRVSRDSSLAPQKKSYIIQNLLMSRWITGQQIAHSKVTTSSNEEKVPGQHPSYRDPLKLAFGCKHYKRNCKLLAPCCNQLYICIRCHDEVADHSLDRKSITKMMCMKCLIIQPIGSTCSTVSCKNLSIARYYCMICKLFDDDREIYHCPYCNLCRVGKGLGIDYFHCMNCNACMSRSLSTHTCREKCFMDNCPICHEDIFSSSTPVKGLSCGHLMHSKCFEEYTCTHYTCPICSKSLGDMQVYFRMLDALLAEEKLPQEYSSKTQDILCNDCEKKGAAPFHWLYHKCFNCGSFNTRLV